MLTKLLFTLAVIAGVVFFSRRRTRAQSSDFTPAPVPQYRGLTVFFGALLLLLVAGLLGYRVWDGHRLLHVSVVSAQGEVAYYTVRKGKLNVDHFTTIEGLYVRLGAQDRIEVNLK
ncbi:hypothetical protein [Ferrimonas pelagia]|uniref:Antitermination protein NusG n=1 Tax=Ferrimonas pelagia TaxID=1177826 RepID=A0ABP9EYZ9_9GAMM